MANENARALRKNQTEAEKTLWRRLRDKQVEGFRFRRQVPIGPYIADFGCHSEKLIVEVDGGQHAENEEYDGARAALMEKEGYRILRFWNNEVFENLDGVLERILETLRIVK